MKIRVFNTTRQKRLPQKKLAKTVEQVLVSEKKTLDVNVILTGVRRMSNLNRAFRGVNHPTDVLSFALDESEEPPPFANTGEIYICIPIAKKQALQTGLGLEKELLFLAVHGALHLCGHDHETLREFESMMRKTKNRLKKAGY